MKAVHADLGLADHATAQIVQEVHGAFGVTLADAPTDDRLLCPGHANKNVPIALGVNLMALDVLLLLAGEGPRLVQFQAVGANPNHDTIV
jgi:hypothetical protein